jgi:hypothetical protein
MFQGRKFSWPCQDLNCGLSAHSILTVLTALCSFILVLDFIYSLLPVTGKLANTTGIMGCANLLNTKLLFRSLFCLQIVSNAVAAFVWQSDTIHMDWGWENREGAVTWPTPVLENFCNSAHEFVVVSSCMMTFSTGLGHFLLTAGVRTIAEWLVILCIYSYPAETCVFMVIVEDTWWRRVVGSWFVCPCPQFSECRFDLFHVQQNCSRLIILCVTACSLLYLV